LELDNQRNQSAETGDRVISSDSATIAVWVIPADEAKEMARQAADLLALGH